MNRFTKFALGALMLTGAATLAAAPASAGVVVGIGAPVAYAPGPVCNPYSPYYNPYYCGYGPAYVGSPRDRVWVRWLAWRRVPRR